MTLFALGQRKTYSRNRNNEIKQNYWFDASHYDDDGFFRGPAIFESEDEAQAYLLKYQTKMMDHVDKYNLANNGYGNNRTGKILNIELKIFEVEKREALPMFMPPNSNIAPAH